ncbi:MAG: glycosylase [Cytophagia bacterium]|nr:glycosylase [Cytophagia bacterium]
MKKLGIIYWLILGVLAINASGVLAQNTFPSELVNFKAYAENPVFTGTNLDTWDKQIRERGFILKEGSNYHLWFTGYSPASTTKFLGYATSKDGIHWDRFSKETIHPGQWVEDMCVVKSGKTYYMFAEGEGDIAHMLVSTDRVHWQEKGNLDIRNVDGSSIRKGAYGTPTVIKAKGVWNLFYERDDLGIWLATSKDLKTWTNVQDEPVIKMGPDAYDLFAVAMNQVIRYKGLYYGYYHASAFKDWHEWSTNIAVSSDLIHWKKYEKNPIMGNNQSSGIVLKDGKGFRLYTMHRKVNLYFSEGASK